MPQPILELAGVCHGYDSRAGRTEVLGGIDLAIEPGEFVAIVGYSGAGKTTLISLIAGLLRADRGDVLFDGRPIAGPSRERAIVFQNYSLIPWLTVAGNIQLAVDELFPTWTKEQKRSHIDQYLAKVNLLPARDKRPAQLSGGMRQRVAVARALAMEPQILLLDEPLSALDALTRSTLQDEIERISREENKTILLITNDVDEGILLADRVIPLTAGPKATLGPSFRIDIPRPRQRAGLNHDPHFKQVRKQIIDWLLTVGKKIAQ